MIPPKYWSPTKKLMLLGAMAGGKLVEDTATGNPLVFITDVSKPLKSLLIPFTPKQEGSGDPSPQNIRTILPLDGLSVFGGGKNLFDKSAKDTSKGYVNSNYLTNTGALSESGNYYVSEYIPITKGDYVASGIQGGGPSICAYDKDKNFIYGKNYASIYPRLYTLPEGTAYIRISVRKENEDITQFEVGSVATAYEPYHPITDTDIVFPSPVYGGEHEAVSGKLLDGWAVKVFDGSRDELWNVRPDQTYGDTFYIETNGKKAGRLGNVCDAFTNITDCWGESGQGKYGVFSDHPTLPWTFFRPPNNSVTTLNEWKAWLAENPIQLAYQLATPQEIQLTPTQLTALVGDNTIWSDADGQMTAVYLKKG